MNVTRRKFLRAGAVSALFAGLTLPPSKLLFAQKKRKHEGFDIPHESKTDPVFYFNQLTFASYVGTEFKLVTGTRGKGVGVRLTEILDRQKELRDARRSTHEGECFSLFFRGPARKSPSQETYRMEHPALGQFSLFLVPGGERGDGVTYEAVINHLA